MLANGSGKTRAGRNGRWCSRQNWGVLFLSAGEIRLAEDMQAAVKKTPVGQAVRLVEMSAGAGVGLGISDRILWRRQRMPPNPIRYATAK